MSRSIKDIAIRLEMTREALGISAAELCRQTRIKPNQWSQFINPDKKRRLTLAAAYKLKDAYGLGLEWLLDGDITGIRDRELAAKIRLKMAA